jgi:tripeptidyl-peptidase I
LKYGKHWTLEEVQEAFAPSDMAIKETISWLMESGIDKNRISQKTPGYIDFHTTISKLEQLLKTEYYIYQHNSGKDHVIACEK